MIQLLVKTPEKFNVMSVPHDNQAVLRELERESQSLAEWVKILGATAIGSAVFVNALLFVIAFLLMPWLDQLRLCVQQISLMQQLMEAFGDEIEIYTNLKPSDLKPIDFFLRFPNKQFVTLMLQSRGDSVVTYNQRTEKLQYRRRKRRGLKNFEPDPLSILNLQTLWIAKERRDLKGGSSRDARRPVGKMIVLWGGTRISEHSDELYTEMSGLRTLRVQKYGSYAFVVEESQAIEAIRAYLAHNAGNHEQTSKTEKALS